ncbi:MAG: hypothetical protein IKJ24_02740, partial [Clostridia bacterium]|nr:hypothetical protein [Clostridia bacterium]
IPAVRTVEHSMDIINMQISDRLRKERENREYQSALGKIKELELNIVKKLSEEIKTSLNDFLPNLKDVSLQTSEDLGLLIRHRQIIH